MISPSKSKSKLTANIDLDKLFKLRLVVTRFGEMDNAKWWNSQGQLSRVGSAAVRRGLPKSHFFAQARASFAIASQRASEVFDLASCITLFQLPAALEDAFDNQWEYWIAHRDSWSVFFESVESVSSSKGDCASLTVSLLELGLIEQSTIEASKKARLLSTSKGLLVGDNFDGSDAEIELLAAGFARGEHGNLIVPYFRGDGK